MYPIEKISSNSTFKRSHKFYQHITNFSGNNSTNDGMTVLSKAIKRNISSFKSNSVIHKLPCAEASAKEYY